MEANARLEKEGYDIFGQYVSQSYFFQVLPGACSCAISRETEGVGEES